MKDEKSIGRAREDALRLLSHRLRSRNEVEDRLARRGWPSDVIERVLSGLERAGLIDDERFVRLWVDERMRLRPRGIALLRQELRRKGISEEVIEKTLREQEHGSDELARARELLQRRQHQYKGLDPQAARRRMAGFLARRGFDGETVYTAVRQILREEKE